MAFCVSLDDVMCERKKIKGGNTIRNESMERKKELYCKCRLRHCEH